MGKSEESHVKQFLSGQPTLLVVVAVVLALAFVGLGIGAAGCSSGNIGGVSNARAMADAFKSSNSSAASTAASDVDITRTTAYLEYSNKKTDPVKLVKVSDDAAKVSTSDEIDLTKVGVQKVKYKVELGDASAEQQVEFTVRDTKGPTIDFSDSNPSIDKGGSFDPQSCISSVADPIDGDLQRVDAEPEPKGSKVGYEQFYDSGWYIVDGTVDSSTPGTYSLKVKASDKHGNVGTRELLVTVNEVVQETETAAPEEPKYTYVKSVNSKKFHVPSCSEAKKIKDYNRQEFTVTRQEMIDMDFEPCKRCKP